MDLFGFNKKIIAKANAKAKLRNIIIPILNKGEFSEADFATLAEFAKENALDEADVRKSITECALQILPKKIKEALKDFNLSDEEYSSLLEMAEKTSISKDQLDMLIAKEKANSLSEYIKYAMKDGELSSSEKEKVEDFAKGAYISETEVNNAINNAKAAYKEEKNKKIKKNLIIVGASIAVLAGLTWGGFTFYRSANTPEIPKELSVAPDPLFEVGDSLSGEITGIFKRHSMPKNSKLTITPYIDCDGKRYYGATETFIGENMEDDGNIVEYDEELPIKIKFNMLNPTYGGKCNLCVHFDGFHEQDNILSEDKTLTRIWNIQKLKEEKEERENIPSAIATFFFILLIISIIGLVMFKRFQYNEVLRLIFMISTAVGLVGLIPAYAVVKSIENEYKELKHQYDKAVRVNRAQSGDSISESSANPATGNEMQQIQQETHHKDLE